MAFVFEKENSIYSLSGEVMSFPFSAWWWQEAEDKTVREVTTSFVESLFDFLQNKNCNIINQEEITSFLNNHIGIIDYLYEAPDVIREKFGQGVGLNLELFFDPEFENDKGELFLNIETDLDAKKANEKLNEIDKKWLIPVVGENITKFNLSLDFI